MTTALLLGVAVAAAVRGVWSPCGLSMLSTITPIGERGRGNRYAKTARWYIAGATFGGLCLGLVMAVPAVLLDHGLGPRFVVGAALVAVASDVDLFGFHLPFHRRQVNERWLDRYRPWVYGAGFGWQVGTGFTTYITTAANYLLVVLGVATGSATAAIAAGTTFGLVRGLSVLLTRGIESPEALLDLHGAVQRSAPRSRDAVVLTEAVIAACAVRDVPSAVVVALTCGVVFLWWYRNVRRTPACSLDPLRLDRPSSPGTPARDSGRHTVSERT